LTVKRSRVLWEWAATKHGYMNQGGEKCTGPDPIKSEGGGSRDAWIDARRTILEPLWTVATARGVRARWGASGGAWWWVEAKNDQVHTLSQRPTNCGDERQSSVDGLMGLKPCRNSPCGHRSAVPVKHVTLG
jgi:hypothetical protein